MKSKKQHSAEINSLLNKQEITHFSDEHLLFIAFERHHLLLPTSTATSIPFRIQLGQLNHRLDQLKPQLSLRFHAANILLQRLHQRDLQRTTTLESAEHVKTFLHRELSCLEREVFMVLYLDTQLRLISHEIIFRGTLAHTAVYPREVIKQALSQNASAVIFAHNHPSGTAKPSQSDLQLTRILIDALKFVDIRVLDHMIIVPGHTPISMAQEKMVNFS